MWDLIRTTQNVSAMTTIDLHQTQELTILLGFFPLNCPCPMSILPSQQTISSLMKSEFKSRHLFLNRFCQSTEGLLFGFVYPYIHYLTRRKVRQRIINLTCRHRSSVPLVYAVGMLLALNVLLHLYGRTWGRRIDRSFSIWLFQFVQPCQCPFVQSAPVGTWIFSALYNTDMSDSLHLWILEDMYPACTLHGELMADDWWPECI